MSAESQEKISARDFIRQLELNSGRRNILAACYYVEFVQEKRDFGTADIAALLDEAKVPHISNLPRDLKDLATSKRYLNVVRGTAGSGSRYTLTHKGVDEVNEWMKVKGMILTKPVERAELLKEIAETLHPLIQRIPDPNEREYIEEAVSCLSPMISALRAAIVLGWAGAVYNLRRKVDQRGPVGYTEFHNHLKAINPKAKPLNTINDLEDIKDTHLLDICEKMNVIAGKSVKNQLDQWLTFRNGVGHPTNVKPGIHKVKAFFEDILEYILTVP